MIDPILKERILESIKKSKALVAISVDSERKQEMIRLIEQIEITFQGIFENDSPCPPHILPRLEEALKEIENLYNEKAAN